MGAGARTRLVCRPRPDPASQSALDRLVAIARAYHLGTGRHLRICGEIGELYGAARLGLRLHRPCAAGSDGRAGNEFVEVKTIGPTSRRRTVTVDTKGHFSKLLIVRVDEAYRLSHRLLDRAVVKRRGQRRVTLRWDDL